jgi:RNA polymerase sigma factor (sigma-70 family)
MKTQDDLSDRDPGRFEKIYRSFFPRVHQTCYLYARNREDAFDWTQDIMIRISLALPAFNGRSTLSTWIYSIARNYCISQVTRNNRHRFLDVSMALGIEAEITDPDDLEARRCKEERETLVSDYLTMLPEQDRRFLELKYFGNYSIKALQEEFRLSASAVKMRLSRARQKAGGIMNARKAA